VLLLVMTCPARFERATYALETLKMRLNNNKNNNFKVFIFGVACAHRSVELGGINRLARGIDRCRVG